MSDEPTNQDPGPNEIPSLGLLRQMPGVLRGMIDNGRVVYGETMPVLDGENGCAKEQFFLVIARGDAHQPLAEFTNLLAEKINELRDQTKNN